jgi:hypothetical protein
MRKAAIAIAVVVLAGCPKSAPSGDAEDAGGTAKAQGDSSTSTSTSTDGGAGDARGSAAAASYSGKYTVTAGTMYVPAEKDWASVKFKNDETKHLGDGEISLAIDAAGRVSGGTESGPLGASVIEGTSEGGALAATIRRKDPADEGLTGTLVAKISGDTIDGTMKLAEFNAAVVREAKLQAKKK